MMFPKIGNLRPQDFQPRLVRHWRGQQSPKKFRGQQQRGQRRQRTVWIAQVRHVDVEAVRGPRKLTWSGTPCWALNVYNKKEELTMRNREHVDLTRKNWDS